MMPEPEAVRELLVYRHGHARAEAETDYARELRDKGKRNAQRIGIWLHQQQLLPDRVITSGAVRARRTAGKTCKTAGLPAQLVRIDERLYLAGRKTLLECLREVPEDTRRVLLVGHNPGLESLLQYLSYDPVPRNAKGRILSPAALAWLQLDVAWQELEKSTAGLRQIVYPQTLPRLFPWPGYDDPASRIRPAYYYHQSSVIPFRYNRGQLEVLLVMSSKRRHWVIPKGIHDPGLTAQESAAKEAYEEAGVEGSVLEPLLGRYAYPKWDASCEVEVYAMRVEKILSAADWQESHRQRQWLPVHQASRLIKNADASRLVGALPEWLGKVENG